MNDREKTSDQLIAENHELRRKVNEELAYFRRFAEAAGQGFSMADLDGRLRYLNPALCRMLELEGPESYIGRHMAVCYGEAATDTGPGGIIPILMQNGHWAGEVFLFTQHRRKIPTLHDCFLIRNENGDPARLAVVITDITERKAAEEALRESEERYRTLVEMSPNAVLMTDLEGRAIYASHRAAELYGFDCPEELLGKGPLELMPPEEHQKFIEQHQRVLESGVSRDVEVVLLRRDGSRFDAEASAAVIRDASAAPKALVVVVRDISERKEAEKALERQRRSLRHMLRASDHERQLIAYDIHDGLAQDLAAAIMQFQVYADVRETKPSEAARLFATGQALLSKSHAEARRLISGVRPPILDESGVVAAVAHLVFDPAFDGGAKIDLRNRVRFKRLDPILENAVYRIIQEGLANARRHSKSERILVSLIQRGERLRIVIRDWGIGFDPAAVRGNRFGIEGIRQRARLLGGTCSIRSKAGKGTRVLVELPVVERESEE